MALRSLGDIFIYIYIRFVCSAFRWIWYFIQFLLTCFLSSRHSVVGLAVIVSLEREEIRETLKHILCIPYNPDG